MATVARAKSMAAATARWIARTRSVPSAFEVERFVDLERPPARLQQEWAVVDCPIREASGCGVHGQAVVQGLTLYARLLTPPDEFTTALYIRFNDGALRGMKSEFGLGSGDPLIQIDEFRGFVASAYVLATDDRSIFFSLVFRLRDRGDRSYYLIYDAVAASLSMIPYLPPDCSSPYTVAPLQMIRGGVCELAILACRPVPLTQDQMEQEMERRKEDVVCVWPQAATPAWEVLGRNFPEQSIRNLFNADVMFSYRGKAIWVDLEQGFVHCDWPPPDGAVDFGFIGLPPGCPPDERWMKPRFEASDMFSMTRDRTMACFNGTIRFVWIDRSSPLGNVNISVWDLHPATKLWTNYKSFLAKELWRLWSFKTADILPEMEPRFPTLMADGSLCFLICNKPKRREDPLEDYICNVQLPKLKVRWWGRLSQYHASEHPVILPFDFFKLLNPLTPRQRNLRGIFTPSSDSPEVLVKSCGCSGCYKFYHCTASFDSIVWSMK